MKNKYLLSLMGLVILSALAVNSVSAKPNTDHVSVTHNKSGRTLTIPAHAVEVAENVFSLGTATVDGQVVEGYMFVDKRDQSARPDNPGGGRNKPGGKSSCYAFLAKDAKWKNNEPWVVNASNLSGLSDSFVLNDLAADIQKWEDESGSDIFGNGSLTNDVLVADESSPDGVNEVYFADIDSPGAIAVTITWGIFSGPPRNRVLLEWDQVYDDTDYDWSTSGEAGKMDFENIASHELGHALGMGHPEDTCTDETMYRYADFEETKKRDLNAGDIAGIQRLY